MAKIDTVYDFTEKGLVELKSWLEPWFLTRDRGTAVATPSAGAGFAFPAFETGYWYASQFCAVGTSATPGQGELHASPFYVPADTTFDRIAVIMTAAWTSTEKTRLGIYANGSSNGSFFPGALVVDAGTVDGTGSATAREKSITISQALTAGIYWLVGVNQGGANNNTVLGHTYFTHIATTRQTITDLNPGSSGYVILKSSVTGALSNPFGAGSGFIGTASAIRVFLRMA